MIQWQHLQHSDVPIYYQYLPHISGSFPVDLGLAGSLSAFFLHPYRERTSGNQWYRTFMGQMSFCVTWKYQSTKGTNQRTNLWPGFNLSSSIPRLLSQQALAPLCQLSEMWTTFGFVHENYLGTASDWRCFRGSAISAILRVSYRSKGHLCSSSKDTRLLRARQRQQWVAWKTLTTLQDSVLLTVPITRTARSHLQQRCVETSPLSVLPVESAPWTAQNRPVNITNNSKPAVTTKQ